MPIFYTDKVSPVSPVVPGYYLGNRGQGKHNNISVLLCLKGVLYPVSPIKRYYIYISPFLFFTPVHMTYIYIMIYRRRLRECVSRIKFWFPAKFRGHRGQEGLSCYNHYEKAVPGSRFQTGDNRRQQNVVKLTVASKQPLK